MIILWIIYDTYADQEKLSFPSLRSLSRLPPLARPVCHAKKIHIWRMMSKPTAAASYVGRSREAFDVHWTDFALAKRK